MTYETPGVGPGVWGFVLLALGLLAAFAYYEIRTTPEYEEEQVMTSQASSLRRRTANGGTPPPVLHEEMMTLPDGRTLARGDEFSLHGGGRYTFYHRYTPDGSITAFGPVNSQQAQWRAFRPEAIKTVHRAVKSHPRTKKGSNS